MGFTRPNPSVGAVIVYNDTIIGEGVTSAYGGNHAEVNAIQSVKDTSLIKESIIYVTLEPCSHYGKTPPCTKSIIKSGNRMMDFMDNDPYAFVMNHKDEDLKALDNFVHRTFNGLDFIYFMKALRNIYLNHNGLEFVFSKNQTAAALYENIHLFKKTFFDLLVTDFTAPNKVTKAVI